jgi:hypothetical protein
LTRKSQAFSKFSTTWNTPSNKENPSSSSLKMLRARHSPPLSSTSSREDSRLLLSSHQVSETTEETPCKILQLPLVVNSLVRRLVSNWKALISQFSVRPRKSLLPRTTQSLWVEMEPNQKLEKELILSRNKLTKPLQSTIRRSSKRD